MIWAGSGGASFSLVRRCGGALASGAFLLRERHVVTSPPTAIGSRSPSAPYINHAKGWSQVAAVLLTSSPWKDEADARP